MLEEDWSHEAAHHAAPTDSFRMDGIGRFVMSQIDSIEILDGNLLKAFLLRQADYIRNALGFSPV